MLKRTNTLLAAVAWGSLSVGGLVYAEDQPARSADTTADDNAAQSRSQQDRALDDPRPGRAATPQRSNEASDQQLTQVRRVLAQATEAALSENGFDCLTALLSRQDQQRLGGAR